VVVLDKHSISDYNTGWFEGEGHISVVVLTPSDQEDMKNGFVKGCHGIVLEEKILATFTPYNMEPQSFGTLMMTML